MGKGGGEEERRCLTRARKIKETGEERLDRKGEEGRGRGRGRGRVKKGVGEVEREGEKKK